MQDKSISFISNISIPFIGNTAILRTRASKNFLRIFLNWRNRHKICKQQHLEFCGIMSCMQMPNYLSCNSEHAMMMWFLRLLASRHLLTQIGTRKNVYHSIQLHLNAFFKMPRINSYQISINKFYMACRVFHKSIKWPWYANTLELY